MDAVSSRDSVFILTSTEALSPAVIERIEENWKSFWEMDGVLVPKMMVLGRGFDLEVQNGGRLRQAGLMSYVSRNVFDGKRALTEEHAARLREISEQEKRSTVREERRGFVFWNKISGEG